MIYCNSSFIFDQQVTLSVAMKFKIKDLGQKSTSVFCYIRINNIKALLFYRVGSLRCKSYWKAYYDKHGISTRCLVVICDQEDTLDHAKFCKYINTKWSSDFYLDSDIADYLVKLNRGRFARFKMPIF